MVQQEGRNLSEITKTMLKDHFDKVKDICKQVDLIGTLDKFEVSCEDLPEVWQSIFEKAK